MSILNKREVNYKTDKQIAEKFADFLFARKIKYKYMDSRGVCRCFTCGKEYHRTEIQLGHCYSRKIKTLRRDEHNSRPQCAVCNQSVKGRFELFFSLLLSRNPKQTNNIKNKAKERSKGNNKKVYHEDIIQIIEKLKKEIITMSDRL